VPTDFPETSLSSSSPINVFINNVTRSLSLLGLFTDSFKWFNIEVANTIEWLSSNPNMDTATWQVFMEHAERRNAEVLNRGPLVLEWWCVLFVTFTETYLFDVLVAASGRNRNLLPKDFSVKLSYEEVCMHGSRDDLELTMREIWARGFVSNGGPKGWAKRLSDLGARIPDEYVEPLEELWGIRHALVHRAGLAGRDFRRLHASVPLSKEGRIIVAKERLGVYMQTATKFVIAIDRFFSAAQASKTPPI
jgi:hypothetical protein